MNQRKSFRCKVFGPAAEAELQLGQTRLSCRLLDESAGGFSAVVQCAGELTPGTIGRLRHKAGWSEVKIVHVTQITPAPQTVGPPQLSLESPKGLQSPASRASAGQDAAAPAVWRLGLERLREVDPPTPSPTNWRVLASLIPLPRLFVRNIPILLCGITMAVVVIAGPLFVVLVLKWPRQLSSISNSAGDLPQRKAVTNSSSVVGLAYGQGESHTGASGKYESPAPRWPVAQLAAELAHAASAGEQRPPAPAVQTNSAPLRHDIGKLAARLPGAAPFEMPQIADTLGLTEQQRAEIKRIVADCTRALESLEWRAAGAGRQQLAAYRQAILREARAEALRLLTPEQLAQWELLAEAPTEDQPAQPATGNQPAGPLRGGP